MHYPSLDEADASELGDVIGDRPEALVAAIAQELDTNASKIVACMKMLPLGIDAFAAAAPMVSAFDLSCPYRRIFETMAKLPIEEIDRRCQDGGIGDPDDLAEFLAYPPNRRRRELVSGMIETMEGHDEQLSDDEEDDEDDEDEGEPQSEGHSELTREVASTSRATAASGATSGAPSASGGASNTTVATGFRWPSSDGASVAAASGSSSAAATANGHATMDISEPTATGSRRHRKRSLDKVQAVYEY